MARRAVRRGRRAEAGAHRMVWGHPATARAPTNLLTLVRTMNVVAVTSCCTRRPAYEMASPLRQEMTMSNQCIDVSALKASPHLAASP